MSLMYSNKLVYPAEEYLKLVRIPKHWDDVIGDGNFSALITGRTGCLHEETEIETPEGSMKIKDCQDILIVKSYDFEKQKEIFKPAIRIKSGKKKLYKITLEDGSHVLASQDHIFFSKNNAKLNEVQLKKLKVGDSILSQENKNC